MSDSKFDIKNLDAAQLTRTMSEHQNTIFKLALVVGSLVLVVLMFADHHNKDRDITIKISQAQEKLTTIKDRDKVIQDIKDFKSKVPKKINESELITLISNYAKLNHVTITSLSPAESKNLGLYDVISVSFNAETENFKQMMLFLRKIEKSSFYVRVDSWVGRENEAGKITFELEINTVIIHS